VTCNWYFLAGSTVFLTLMGWLVTARVVEPRFGAAATDLAAGEPEPLTGAERRGLVAALLAILLVAGLVGALIAIPGAPLHGPAPVRTPGYGPIPAVAPGGAAVAAGPTQLPPRWSLAVVPLILVSFLVPGLAYGLVTRTVRRPADVSAAFTYAMSSMAPITAMAFFAAQFIECFRYSQLDAMLANAGGKALVASGLPRPLLLVGVVVLVMGVNMLMASMSAKWTALSTVLVPMLMMAGIAPELTQAAYRVGDSVTNTVTPLNGYLLVILAVLQRYRREAGLGNLIAMMLPYAAVFAVTWTLFLLGWVWLDLPLGPGARLWYVPPPHG
jgi:aminobenzoyl-glutamate transport protein